MSDKACIVGVGVVPFQKPGKSESDDVMAAKATRAALENASLDYDKVQQAYAGYVYGDSTCGQRALYHVGMTGIPVVNVNNNCSTGSTALFLARQAVENLLRWALLIVMTVSLSSTAVAQGNKDKETEVYWIPDVFTVEERTAIADTGAVTWEVGHDYVLVEATAQEKEKIDGN